MRNPSEALLIANPTRNPAQVDEELDAETPNAGTYRFEKMVSGLYMGEVARRIILRLAVRPPCPPLSVASLACRHACMLHPYSGRLESMDVTHPTAWRLDLSHLEREALLAGAHASMKGRCRLACFGAVQEDGELFGRSVPDELRRPGALSTPAMSRIDQDAGWLLAATAQEIVECFGLPPARCTYSVCSRVGALLRLPFSCHARLRAALLRWFRGAGAGVDLSAIPLCSMQRQWGASLDA
jgi:hypothetical protein